MPIGLGAILVAHESASAFVSGWTLGRHCRWQPCTSRALTTERRARRSDGEPTPEEVSVALGRELWLASEMLLETSSILLEVPDPDPPRPRNPRLGLTNAASYLKNAADYMIDLEHDYIMGELECAAASCKVLPERNFQGLVDLFSYVEVAPQIAWPEAEKSLRRLAGSLETLASDYEFLAPSVSMECNKTVKVFLRASRLLRSGEFYWPEDYRAMAQEEATMGREVFREEAFDKLRKRLLAEALSAVEPGSAAAEALLQAADEVAEVSRDEAQRKAKLLKMVRESHPDRNSGREEEMTPVFLFVQKLRENA